MSLGRKACEHLVDGHRVECVVGWASAPADGLNADDLMYVAEAGAQSTAAFRRAGGQVTVPGTGPGGGRVGRPALRGRRPDPAGPVVHFPPWTARPSRQRPSACSWAACPANARCRSGLAATASDALRRERLPGGGDRRAAGRRPPHRRGGCGSRLPGSARPLRRRRDHPGTARGDGDPLHWLWCARLGSRHEQGGGQEGRRREWIADPRLLRSRSRTRAQPRPPAGSRPSWGLPVMLKPVQEGSSLGVSKCKTAEHLESCIEAGRAEFGKMFAEQLRRRDRDHRGRDRTRRTSGSPSHPGTGAQERVLRLRRQVHGGDDRVHPSRPAGARTSTPRPSVRPSPSSRLSAAAAIPAST